MTWRRTQGGARFGWAVPDLDPDTNEVSEHGSFIWTGTGEVRGLGVLVTAGLPSGRIPERATLSLRYHPVRGTMHARVDGGAEVVCCTGLRNDLVPAVIMYRQGDACDVVVRGVF